MSFWAVSMSWEIAIDGDTMKWTALRENEEDGSTYTATFEMKKVK